MIRWLNFEQAGTFGKEKSRIAGRLSLPPDNCCAPEGTTGVLPIESRSAAQ